jgi:hypothetical protein
MQQAVNTPPAIYDTMVQRADLKTLHRESRAWNRRMNRDRIKINWKFDRRAARRRFGYGRRSFKRSPT